MLRSARRVRKVLRLVALNSLRRLSLTLGGRDKLIITIRQCRSAKDLGIKSQTELPLESWQTCNFEILPGDKFDVSVSYAGEQCYDVDHARRLVQAALAGLVRVLRQSPVAVRSAETLPLFSHRGGRI